MKNRIFAILIACALIASLAACGSPAPAATTQAATTAAPATTTAAPATTAAPTTTAAPAEPELPPYEIVYCLLSNEVYSDIAVVEEAINALTVPLINATVKFRQGTWSDWEERALLPIQAGEKTDLVFTADWYHYMRSITQNIIIPLDDPNSQYGDLLNTYAPDAVRLLGDAFIKGVQVDGIAYGVPTNKELTVPRGMQWNETLVEKYNIDIDSIMTDRDLDEVFAIVKEGEGRDFYPLLGYGWMNPYFNVAGGVSEAVMRNDRLPDGKDDMTIYWLPETPEYAAHLDHFREWNLLGYINPDAALTTYRDTEDRFAGRFLVNSGKALTYEGNDAAEMMAASGNPELRLVDRVREESRQITTHAGGSMMSIPITSQDPVRAMMLLNLMHSDANLISTMVFGVEGRHFTKVSANVARVNDDDSWYGVHAGPWIFGNQYIQWTADGIDTTDKYDLLRAFSQSGDPHVSLGFRFILEPVENEVAAIASVRTAERSLLSGSVDPKVELPKYIQAMKDAGAEKVLLEVVNQFNKWLGN